MLAVIRPYGAFIRDHVFDILQRSGIDTSAPVVVGEAETDTQVVRQLAGKPLAAILAPYHIERRADGLIVNGLTALSALIEADGLPPKIPVLMPVSIFGKVAYEAEYAKLPETYRSRLDYQALVMEGPFDDHEKHIRLVRDFLRTLGSDTA